MDANFENFLFHLISYKILGKVTKVSKSSLKSSESYGKKKLRGSLKPPPPDRIGLTVFLTIKLLCIDTQILFPVLNHDVFVSNLLKQSYQIPGWNGSVLIKKNFKTARRFKNLRHTDGNWIIKKKRRRTHQSFPSQT